jgi:hypothetical protein
MGDDRHQPPADVAELPRRAERINLGPLTAPRPPAQPREWTTAEQSLVDWLAAADLPVEPFVLDQARKVPDPRVFVDSLRRDTEAGPGGPRARTGALRSDLEILRKRFAEPVNCAGAESAGEAT